jgi:ubiquinone biosynthesis protein COQ9
MCVVCECCSWTIEALAAGATDLGYPSVAHGMFSRGAIELVDYFMDKSNDELHDILVANTEKLQLMSVTDRLKFGVRARLEMLAPVLPTWPQAMALGALPQNAPTTFAKLAKLSDEIWYFAGDKATDASWYTKRALLTGIYASTELFMLSDQSPGFQDTWAFLDRRIDETITLGELPQNVRCFCTVFYNLMRLINV